MISKNRYDVIFVKCKNRMETTYFDLLPSEIVDMIFEMARIMEIEDDERREQEEYWNSVRDQENN